MVFVVQAPGEEEERLGRPLVGKTGFMFDNQLLPKAGLTRGSPLVGVANVLKCRWAGDNALPLAKLLNPAVTHCTTAHLRLPASARLVVAMGQLAVRRLTPLTSEFEALGQWVDGTNEAEGKRVFVLFHPAYLYRDITLKGPYFHWFRKIGAMVRPEWHPPVERFTVDPPPDDLAAWLDEAKRSDYIVCDTEFYRTNGWHTASLTILGLGLSDGRVLVVDWHNIDPVRRRIIAERLPDLMRDKRWVFHEAMADLPVLERTFGATPIVYDDTILMHHALWCELPHHLAFLGSMYTDRPYHKHLKAASGQQGLWYCARDVVTTQECFARLTVELGTDREVLRNYHSKRIRMVPIALQVRQDGVGLVAESVLRHRAEAEEMRERAQSEARALAGWDINLNSDDQLFAWAYDAMGYKEQVKKRKGTRTMDKDALAKLTKLYPDEPFFKSLREFRRADYDLSHYIMPCFNDDGTVKARLHFDVGLHSQNTTRWSISEPALGTLPKWLQDMVCALPGEHWIKFDYDAIELRIQAVLGSDKPLLEAFAKGHDVHTIHSCQTFGWPLPSNLVNPHDDPADADWRASWRFQWGDRPSPLPGWDGHWLGKDDPRRVFNKRAAYKLSYGGKPEFMDDIPEAEVLGLDTQALSLWGQRYLDYHPGVRALQARLTDLVRTRGVVYGYDGRRWVFLQRLDKAIREGLDYPMQAGVQGIMEDTILMIREALPEWRLRLLLHDGNIGGVPLDKPLLDVYNLIRPIVERPVQLAPDVPPYSFPATFKGGTVWAHLGGIK